MYLNLAPPPEIATRPVETWMLCGSLSAWITKRPRQLEIFTGAVAEWWHSSDGAPNQER
jgi:hypothetical protein